MDRHSAKTGNFVVLSTQRTGSTWMVDTLGSHPELNVYTELFLRSGYGVPDWSRNKDFQYWNTFASEQVNRGWGGFRPIKVFNYLDLVFSRYEDESEAVGFKLMYDQLRRYPEILPYIILNKLKIIHLYRENIVASVISNILRAERKAAHVKVGDEIEPVCVQVDVEKTYKEIVFSDKKSKMMRRLVPMLPVPSLEISYETLSGDLGMFSCIFEFLEVDNCEVSSSLQKLNTRPISESIKNIDVLMAKLKDSDYETMLKALT